MTGAQRGFLLLSSHLGDPKRDVLSTAQLRTLALRAGQMEVPEDVRDLTEKDLQNLGYNEIMSRRILRLLSQETLLDEYLSQARWEDCTPVTRNSAEYPDQLKSRLGWEAPGCLWCKGDLELLRRPAISLVGSRNIAMKNQMFASAVGMYAATNGYVLVSGNARGADQTAQESCLRAGGSVISIVADSLNLHPNRENMLLVSEEGFDETFTIPRALSRNRCIHAMGQMVFVAQAELKKGGSWHGAADNLRHGWSPVVCLRDGSEASRALERMGAYLIRSSELRDFNLFPEEQLTFPELEDVEL